MSAISKIDALTALASGKTVAYTFQEVETVIDKTWSIERILSCQCDFYIKIETITLAGFTFLKPFCLEELVADQEVFLIGNTGSIIQGKFIPEYDDLVSAVKNGSVQRDKGNATNQAKAIQAVLGFNHPLEFKTLDFHTYMNSNDIKPAPKKRVKTKEIPVAKVEISIESELQLYLDGIKACNNESEIESTLLNAEKIGFSSEQMLEITMAKESKLAEFSQAITQILQNSAIKFEDSLVADPEYQKHLEELLDSAAKAQTPVEANALIRYTKSWTEEQRQPLIIAISKRLGELEQPVYAEVPSLMTRILNAPDLNEIGRLLAEVRGRHPDIQPKLMGYINQRRFELNNPVDDEPVKIEVS